MKKPETSANSTQTVQPMLGQNILMFATLKADQQEARTTGVHVQSSTEQAQLTISKRKRKRPTSVKDTQTETKETASQLMQAELICQPEERETEIRMIYRPHESTSHSMTQATSKCEFQLTV